jgi:FKBP-type peptidyl-prolyl cis-trans isomerase FkpA
LNAIRGGQFFRVAGALVCVVAMLTAVACSDSNPESPSPTTPPAAYSQTDVRVGTGAEAVNGRQLTVHYTLWLYDPAAVEFKGRQMQSSVGGTPFPFTLGAGGVIRGWDQGVVGMRVGGLRRLVLPPSLAYGATGTNDGSIPPNTSLVFDIELLSVQ